MPIYRLRLGERTYYINARGKRGALVLARSMLTNDTPTDEVVTVVEGEDGDGPMIFEATAGEMLASDAGRARPLP